MAWRMLKRAFSATVVAAALTLGGGTVEVGGVAPVVEEAQAGQYHVYACRTPLGESAPADGWSPSTIGAGADTEDTCPQGGALLAALRVQSMHPAGANKAAWAFGAPANETIAGATLWRAGYLHGEVNESATYEFWLAGPLDVNIIDECIYTKGCMGQGESAQPLSNANRLTIPSANLGAHLYTNVSCEGNPGNECKAGAGDANGYAAVVYLYAADITLEQTGGPSASNVAGELAGAPSVRGTSDVTFAAADPGAGVYEAVFTVDGQVVQSTPLDDNGGHCKSVGQGGGLAFLYVQPCEQAVSVDVPFDTTKLSNGAHHLLVSVLDAAGNSAPVLDRTITVANPPPPAPPGPANGTNASSRATLTASWQGSSAKARIVSAYGREPAIVGRLTGPGGAAIGGARIDVLDTPAYTGAKPFALASPRTAANGGFSVRLPHSVASGELTLAYRAHLDVEPPAASRALGLTVRAGITLRISPRRTSVGHTIRFAGQLHGAPLPPEGKQLVLEARSAGSGWIEFDVIRTSAKGRFHSTYRFKFPGPAGYRFRVVSNAEADFPFATGASNAVGVYER
jgi:hypothetical protein